MLKVLDEFYIGKTPVLPIEENIDAIRRKFRGKHIGPTTNLDPDILKLDRIIEKIFGFYNVCISILPNNIPNAAAFCLDSIYSVEERKILYKNMISNTSGFRYSDVSPGVSIGIFINVGLLDMDDMSNAEITGILLHEIGHTFFEAIVDNDLSMSQYTNCVSITDRVLKFAMDKIKSGKEITSNIIDRELAMFDKGFRKLKSLFSNIGKNRIHESMYDNLRSDRLIYTDEKVADTFATIYGYGPELHSALMKIDSKFYVKWKDRERQYGPIVEKIKLYKMLAKEWLEHVILKKYDDPHPNDLARIKISIEYLKREISKEGMDPKTKRNIIYQISTLQKSIDDYINYPKSEDHTRMTRLYLTKLYYKFGGDRRETDTDNKALFNTIDKRYYDKYESGE